MTAALPDISLTGHSPDFIPLDGVGMQGIDLPVTFTEPGYRRELHARVDAEVDLPARHIKGIHMSRLYRLLDGLGTDQPITPAGLRHLLQAMVESHASCESRGARVRLRFELLTRRQALISDDLAGWKSYPVCLDARLSDGAFALEATVTVRYSSTCPCSAALSRQLVAQGFLDAFEHAGQLESRAVADWLRDHASLATPHSQRSEATVSVTLDTEATGFGLIQLIDRIEATLGTPVQTAVKRPDEQAFAALNGQNLMFVEDASRRIVAALGDTYADPDVHVRHMESLHPHDAIAWARPRRPAADSRQP